MAYKTRNDYKALKPATKAAISRLITAQYTALMNTKTASDLRSIQTEDIKASASFMASEIYDFVRKLKEIIDASFGRLDFAAVGGNKAELVSDIYSEVFYADAVAAYETALSTSHSMNKVAGEDWTVQPLHNRTIVIKADHLAPAMRFKDRRFIVSESGGFGAEPNARGNAIFGKWSDTGTESRVERYMVAGIAANLPTVETGFVDLDLKTILDDVQQSQKPREIKAPESLAIFGAGTQLGAGEDHWKRAHNRAVQHTFARKPWEAAMVGGIESWAGYARTYSAEYPDNILAMDYVLGDAWQAWGKALLTLLNGSLGRLDGGTCDGFIRDTAKAYGFTEELEVAK